MRNRFLKSLILVALCIWCTKGFCQNDNEFFIVTVESKSSPNIHGSEKHYWIVPVNSVVEFHNFLIYPLYLTDFSKDKLDRCNEGKTIEVFTSTTESNNDFSNDYLQVISELKNTVYSGRRKVQTITKKWSRKQKKVVRIYLTPITGDFSFCKTSDKEKKYFNHNGTISLPKGSFNINNALWESEKGKEMLFADFTEFTMSNKE